MAQNATTVRPFLLLYFSISTVSLSVLGPLNRRHHVDECYFIVVGRDGYLDHDRMVVRRRERNFQLPRGAL